LDAALRLGEHAACKALFLAPLLIQDKLIGVAGAGAAGSSQMNWRKKCSSEALALLTSAVETLNHNLRLQQDAPAPTLSRSTT
jgi:hypothetical protein